MARNVFLSYAASDRSRTPELVQRLRRLGALTADDNVFVDHESFHAGDNFRDATRAAIEAADTVVVLWSPAAAESKWVNYELAMADALGKQLLVVSPKGASAELPIDNHSVERLELAGVY